MIYIKAITLSLKNKIMEELEKKFKIFFDRSLKEKVKETKKILEKFCGKKTIFLWSGGKDSTVLLYLALKANPDLKIVFINTGMEFPETMRFIYKIARKWKIKNLKILRSGVSYWHIPPSPLKHFLPCTYWLKIQPVLELFKKEEIRYQILGDRGSEHAKRMAMISNGLVHRDRLGDKLTIYPIGYWSDDDIKKFSEINNIPKNPMYRKGYNRTGCMLCPYQDFKNLKRYDKKFVSYLLLETETLNIEELKLFLKEKLTHKKSNP